MVRNIVHIDEEKCTGCGLCANACHEGAIEMVNGKAHLIRDDYCDGFGDCLPECPAGAITISKREAVAYDEEAVARRMWEQGKVYQKVAHRAQTENKPEKVVVMQADGEHEEMETLENRMTGTDGAAAVTREVVHGRPEGFGGCPGSRVRMMNRRTGQEAGRASAEEKPAAGSGFRAEEPSGQAQTRPVQSELQTWPVQLKLVPAVAPFFENAKLLIAADCTAYAYARFHEDFIKNHVVLIGCPKLDRVEYTDKIQAILERNNIKSLEIVRMEVPCCGGLEYAATEALKNSGKFIPWRVITIGIDGRIVEDD